MAKKTERILKMKYLYGVFLGLVICLLFAIVYNNHKAYQNLNQARENLEAAKLMLSEAQSMTHHPRKKRLFTDGTTLNHSMSLNIQRSLPTTIDFDQEYYHQYGNDHIQVMIQFLTFSGVLPRELEVQRTVFTTVGEPVTYIIRVYFQDGNYEDYEFVFDEGGTSMNKLER